MLESNLVQAFIACNISVDDDAGRLRGSELFCFACTTHSSRYLICIQPSFFHKLDLPVHGKTVLAL
jgi:hypothetical protein